MSDQPIVVPVVPALEGVASFAAGLESLSKLIDQAAEFDPKGKMKKQLSDISAELRQLVGTTAGVYAELTKSMSEAVKNGSEEALNTVRAARQRIQNEYEKISALGAMSVPQIAKFKEDGASLFPNHKTELEEALAVQKIMKQAQDAQLADELLSAKAAAKAQSDLVAGLNAQLKFSHAERLQQQKDADAALDGLAKQSLSQYKANQDQVLSTVTGLNAQLKYLHNNREAEQREAERALDALAKESLTQFKAGQAQIASTVASINSQLKFLYAEREAAADRSMKALTSSAYAQVKAATFQPAGAYSTVSSGNLNQVKNSDLDMMMPSKALFQEAEAAKAAAAAHASLTEQTARGAAPTSALTSEKAKLTAQMNDLHSAARGLASGFNAMWLTWGNILPLVAGAAVSGAIVQSIKDYADLEHQLKFVQAIAQDTSVSMSDMMKAVGSVSVEFGVAPAKAAEGVVALAQAGLSAKESLQDLNTVMAVAVLGQMSMSDAAVSLTGATYAFGTGLKSMEHIGDVYVKAAAVSNTSVASITESMKQASSVAQEYGLSVEDVGVALTALAKRNITGSAAGTAFRNLMDELGAPKGEAKRLSSTLKVELFDPMTNDTKDFFGRFVPELREKLKVFDPQSQVFIMNRLTNNRGAKALSAILGMSDENLADLKMQFENATGTAARGVIELNDSVEGDLGKLKASFADSLGKAAEGGSDRLRASMQTLRETVESEGFKTAVETLVGAFTGLLNIAAKLTQFLFTPTGLIAAFAASAAGLQLLSVAAAGATGAAATLVGVLTTLLRFSLVGAVITGVAIAVGYLWEKLSEQSPSQQAASTIEGLIAKQKEYNKTLQDSIDKLDEKAGIESATKSAVREKLDAQIESVRERMNAEAPSPNAQNSRDGKSALDLAAARKDREDAKSEYASLIAQRDELLKIEEQSRTKEAELRTKQNAAAAKARDEARNLLPSGTQHLVETPSGKNPAVNDNSLQQITKQYESEISLIKAFESDKLKVASAMRSANLISQEGYYAQEIILAENAQRAELEVIQRRKAEYEDAYIKKLAGLQPKSSDSTDTRTKLASERENLARERISAEQKFSDDERKLIDAANTRKILQEIAFSGELKKVKDDARARDQAQTLDDARKARAYDTADQVRRATPEQGVVLSAQLAEQERLTRAVEDADKAINDLNQAYQDRVQAAKDADDQSLATIHSLIEEEDRVKKLTAAKRADRDVLAASIPARSEKVGNDAAADLKKTKEAEADWLLGSKSALEAYARSANDVAKNMGNVFTKLFKGMEDGIVSFVKTGQLDFASLADSIIEDLIRIAVQKSITGPLSQSMENSSIFSSAASFFMSANGNAFDTSGVQRFANGGAFTNGIYTEPTNFKFATGAGFGLGQMAEAGPEAVMPLTRGANGKLGVQASGAGGGSTLTVNIIESNEKGGQVQRRTDSNGGDILDVFVAKVKSSIAGDITKGSGEIPDALATTYGVSRVPGSY